MTHDFNRTVVEQVAHRPWPLPARPWIMTQTWHDLLFAHWPVPAEILRAKIPGAFMLDLFHGRAWIGIVPFHMSNVAPRFVPALPVLSAFPELNVRTYVRVADKPGVYFFSLDAASALAVRAARLLFNLPYFRAAMQVTLIGGGSAGGNGGTIAYASSRRDARAPADFVATYSPAGRVFEARPGSLEYFLTERYCLYALDHRRRPYRLQIHHPPWPLQPADARFTRNTMADAHGIPLPETMPLLHFSRRQDMVGWAPEAVEAM